MSVASSSPLTVAQEHWQWKGMQSSREKAVVLVDRAQPVMDRFIPDLFLLFSFPCQTEIRSCISTIPWRVSYEIYIDLRRRWHPAR